jgi:toxin-antitoxin system PIN domain toxin
MLMPDVNILVYAHREESAHHARYARWLKELATGFEPFAMSEPVMQGFVRVVTNRKIFAPASTAKQAFQFLDALTARPTSTVLRPGSRHAAIFRQLCESGGLQGKVVADAAHAALAIETGCEWVSADTDFARFTPLLRWQHL